MTKHKNSVTVNIHVTDLDYIPLPAHECESVTWDVAGDELGESHERYDPECSGRLFCPVPSGQLYEPLLFDFKEVGLNRYLEESVCACCHKTYAVIFAEQRQVAKDQIASCLDVVQRAISMALIK
jgi:hypothetical protein